MLTGREEHMMSLASLAVQLAVISPLLGAVSCFGTRTCHDAILPFHGQTGVAPDSRILLRADIHDFAGRLKDGVSLVGPDGAADFELAVDREEIEVLPAQALEPGTWTVIGLDRYQLADANSPPLGGALAATSVFHVGGTPTIIGAWWSDDLQTRAEVQFSEPVSAEALEEHLELQLWSGATAPPEAILVNSAVLGSRWLIKEAVEVGSGRTAQSVAQLRVLEGLLSDRGEAFELSPSLAIEFKRSGTREPYMGSRWCEFF